MSEESAVPSGIRPSADWRDPSSYQTLLKLDRAGWAWEWLRRNPEFEAARQNSSMSGSWEHPATGPRVVTLPKVPLAMPWGVLFRRERRRILECIGQLVGAFDPCRGGDSRCRRCFRRPPHRAAAYHPATAGCRTSFDQRWFAASATRRDQWQCVRWASPFSVCALRLSASRGESAGSSTAGSSLAARAFAASSLPTGAARHPVDSTTPCPGRHACRSQLP